MFSGRQSGRGRSQEPHSLGRIRGGNEADETDRQSVHSKNPVRAGIIEVIGCRCYPPAAMNAVLPSLPATLYACFRARAGTQMEILALRHQLAVVERTARRRPNLAPADRLFWVLLSGVRADWRSALLIVKESSPRPGRVVTVLQNELSFWHGHSRNCASRNQSEKPGTNGRHNPVAGQSFHE